ncbi:hypothetical protein OF381_10495 [Mannheimia haemolytica]
MTKAIQALLTILLFLGMTGIIFALFYFDLNKDLENVFMFLTGSISTAFTQSINYWIGSSRGSAEKQEIMRGAKNGSAKL